MSTPLPVITREGIDATVSLETGRHGGPVVVFRDSNGSTVAGVKAEHATAVVLGAFLDPGTVCTVLDAFGLEG